MSTKLWLLKNAARDVVGALVTPQDAREHQTAYAIGGYTVEPCTLPTERDAEVLAWAKRQADARTVWESCRCAIEYCVHHAAYLTVSKRTDEASRGLTDERERAREIDETLDAMYATTAGFPKAVSGTPTRRGTTPFDALPPAFQPQEPTNG